jgi:hypothetical protein
VKRFWTFISLLLSTPAGLLAQETTAERTNPMAALLGGSCCLMFGLAWFVIGILLMIWVYKDAKARGQNAVLWLILTFLFGIIAFIVWLIIRPKEKVGEAPKLPETPNPV